AKQQQRCSRLWCSKGLVNKTDNYSDDRPLDEVSRSLHQSEFQPDVQVYVVVQHKCANHEYADENAQARTSRNARSALMNHCEQYGDNQNRYYSSDESDGHHSHHFFLRPEYGRVLVAFLDQAWQQPKHQEAKGKRRNRATKRRQPETGIVHLHSSTNCGSKSQPVRQDWFAQTMMILAGRDMETPLCIRFRTLLITT